MRDVFRHRRASVAARVLGLLLLLGCLPVANPAAAADETALKPAYRLGVFPYLPALTIDRLYGPLADSFALQLDRMVKLRTKSTFENFARAIEEESYDILFVHPFFFVEAVDHYGYLPLARLEQPLQAVLAAMEDGGAQDLAELAGQTIGLPPRLAAVSSLIKSALMDQGFRPGLDIGIRHFRNHASCLEALTAGAIAACGVPTFMPETSEVLWRRPLRILFEAPPVSGYAFVAHGRVPRQDREALQALLLALGEGSVEGIAGDQRFVPIGADDYASVRHQTSRLQTLAQR